MARSTSPRCKAGGSDYYAGGAGADGGGGGFQGMTPADPTWEQVRRAARVCVALGESQLGRDIIYIKEARVCKLCLYLLP